MTDDALDWGDLRADACAEYGSEPSPQLEARVVGIFRAHPELVARVIADVARAHAAGEIYAPWPILATRLEREAERAARAHEVKASGGPDRERAVERAERYLRSVGYLHQTEDEVRAELFDERGRLREFAGDVELEARMLELWRLVRPLGERVEREQLARAERWKDAHQPPLVAPIAPAPPDLDADIDWNKQLT